MNPVLRSFVICIVLCFTVIAVNTNNGRAQSQTTVYDYTRADNFFKAGQAAYQNNDLVSAITNFQSALKLWPVHQGAWQWLTAAYRHLDRLEDYKHALFFRERTAWALDVDLRHAKRIFEDVARGQKRETPLDARYVITAKDLIVFYRFIICRIQTARETELARRLTINQRYGLEKIFGLSPDPKKRKC